MRSLLGALVFTALLSASPSSDAQSNPVLEHYQAYRAALDQGDLSRAEGEAALALAASEARDGNGGNTAALALNLATTRLLRGYAQGAEAPAQRAYMLAQAGAAGVDPQLAALTLGRAELATQGSAGAERIRGVINSGRLNALPAEDVYLAAWELGLWEFRQQRYDVAKSAFDTAIAHAAGSQFGETYGNARATTWSAAAEFLGDATRHREMRAEVALDVRRKLDQAIGALAPSAEGSNSPQLTLDQQAYAEALAWRAVFRAKIATDHVRLPVESRAVSQLGTVAQCNYNITPHPLPAYPEEQQAADRLGGAVVGVHVGDAGVTDRSVLASVGDSSFAQSLTRAASQWTVTKLPGSAASCPTRTLFVAVSFDLNTQTSDRRDSIH